MQQGGIPSAGLHEGTQWSNPLGFLTNAHTNRRMHTHRQHSFGRTREGTQWSNPIGFLTGTLTDERVRTHANDRHFFGQMPNEETPLHSQQDCWPSESCEAPHIPSHSQTERVGTDDKSTHTLTRLSSGQIIPRAIIRNIAMDSSQDTKHLLHGIIPTVNTDSS